MDVSSESRPTGWRAAGAASRAVAVAVATALLAGLIAMPGCSSKTCNDCGETFSGQAYYQSYSSNPNYNPYREDGGERYEGAGTICEECAQDRWGDDYRDHKAK